MVLENISPLSFDKGLELKIHEKAQDIFEAKPEIAQLKLITKPRKIDLAEKKAMHAPGPESIECRSQVDTLHRESNILPHILEIRQRRSWTTLDISLDLFKDVLEVYKIFPQIWKCVFVFGRKTEDNEFEFPGCMSHIQYGKKECDQANFSELAYVLRRVEKHGRGPLTGEFSPWSIRQTAVYHQSKNTVCCKEASRVPKSTFLLIAPSPDARMHLSSVLDPELAIPPNVASTQIHLLLIADSLRGWMDYMSWLDTQISTQSKSVVCIERDKRQKHLASLTNPNGDFKDRQVLKLLEDRVIDLQVILPTLVYTVTRIQQHVQAYCELECRAQEQHCACRYALRQLDEHIKDIDLCRSRAKVLRDKARSTTQLVSDLLSYENGSALKDVANESQAESKSMIQLTETSTRDAAAVKVLTIISLIYLPTTIVANFFSTQFVQISDGGDMYVLASAWLLAAVSIPLTLVTIATWWVWTQIKVSRLFAMPYFRRIGVCKLLFDDCSWLAFWRTEGQDSEDLEVGDCPHPRTSPESSPETSYASASGDLMKHDSVYGLKSRLSERGSSIV